MRLPIRSEIIPPLEGWKESTYYIVEVSFFPSNPIHNKIFYSGFIVDGKPAGYNQLFTHGTVGLRRAIDIYYMKALEEIKGKISHP